MSRDVGLSSQDGNSVRDGVLEWFDTKGVFWWSTGLESGVTQRRFETGLTSEENTLGSSTIFADRSFVKAIETDDGDAVVKVFDRDTGEVTTTVTLVGLSDRLWAEEMSLWSITIAPGWA